MDSYNVKCIMCGKEFTAGSNTAKYCSQDCYEQYQKQKAEEKKNIINELPIKYCEKCNTPFKPKNEFQIYCKKCKNKTKPKPKKKSKYKPKNKDNNKTLKPRKNNKYTNICMYCLKSFTTTNKKKKFCSTECYCKAFNIPEKNIIKSCLYCKKEFKTNNINDEFCSKMCKRRYDNEYIENLLFYDRVCIQCGKHFKTIISSDNICSKRCEKNYNNKINNIKNTKKYKSKKDKITKQPILINSYIEPLGEQKIFNGQIINMWNVSGFTEELREKVLERDDWKCYICGRETNLHVHHIIPREQGGAHSIENLITLCAGCHRSIETGDMENAIIKCTQRAINNINI